MTLDLEIRVSSVLSQNPLGFGGCVFGAKPLNRSGEVSDAGTNLMVKASGFVLSGVAVQTGQWWRIKGSSKSQVREKNGFKFNETLVTAESAELIQPSGDYIIHFLADNSAFVGVGPTKARKLWLRLGPDLYRILDAGDAAALQPDLTVETAARVVTVWQQLGQSKLLQWLQAQGFPRRLGKKVIEFFGNDAASKIEEDPYRLLSFSAKWSEVDALARGHFEIALDDPRRLQGAVEEACYRIFAGGHTTALSDTLQRELRAVLSPRQGSLHRSPLVEKALSDGFAAGTFVRGLHGVQPLGAHVMEVEVAQAVATRLQGPPSLLIDLPALLALLADYERSEGIALNGEQRAAIEMALSTPFAVIKGGAGVGKTTVLKALYKAFDTASIRVTQLALAGRAAKRMMEATGRPASTIASFLSKGRPELGPQDVIVVDEASMVDIMTMSALCHAIGTTPRLLLVGDPKQLMPVGPGLVLHALELVPQVPVAELKVIKRYGGLIASAAQQIRDGMWPQLPRDRTQSISFLSASADEVSELVLQLYREAPGDTQILCGRRGSQDGTHHLNATLQKALTAETAPLRFWMAQKESMAQVDFHVGDPLLCTRNLYDHGLQNGSLGVIVALEVPLVPEEGEVREGPGPLASVLWDDGLKRPLFESMLDDVELGYAITVHKAQGSQWPRIIVPLSGSRLLDRTLVYTAVTRAQNQVILVGDEEAVAQAVRAEPRSRSRMVSLDLILKTLLRNK